METSRRTQEAECLHGRRATDAPPSPLRLTAWAKAFEFATLVALASIVPRALGSESYGSFVLAATVVAIGSLSLSLGGLALFSRFLPASGPSRAALARSLAIRLLHWRLVGLALVALATGALAFAAPGTVRPLWVLLVALALAFDVLATLAFQLALGLGHTRLWSFRYGLQNAVLITAALAGWELYGLSGAIAGVTLASAFALACGAVFVLPLLVRAPAGTPIPPGVLRFGAYSTATGFLANVLQRGAAPAVALLDGGGREVGFAGLAAGAMWAAGFALNQVLLVQLPALAERVAGDPVGVEAEARRLATGLGVLALSAACAGALLVDPVVPTVLGEEFRDATAAFRPALAVLPLVPLVSLGNQVAMLRIEPGRRLLATGLGTAVFAVISGLAVPGWGAAGATAALFGGMVATSFALAVAFPQAIGWRMCTLGGAGSVLVLVLAYGA